MLNLVIQNGPLRLGNTTAKKVRKENPNWKKARPKRARDRRKARGDKVTEMVKIPAEEILKKSKAKNKTYKEALQSKPSVELQVEPEKLKCLLERKAIDEKITQGKPYRSEEDGNCSRIRNLHLSRGITMDLLKRWVTYNEVCPGCQIAGMKDIAHLESSGYQDMPYVEGEKNSGTILTFVYRMDGMIRE